MSARQRGLSACFLSAKLSKAGCWGKLPSTRYADFGVSSLERSGSVASNHTIRSQKPKAKTFIKANLPVCQRGLSAKQSKAVLPKKATPITLLC